MTPQNKSSKKGANISKGLKNLPPLCIRCPNPDVAATNNHQNDFTKCHAAYLTIAVGNQPAPNTASDFWWGFTDGPNTLTTLFNEDTCNNLLNHARALIDNNDKLKPAFMLTEQEERDRITGSIKAKQAATFDNKIITKGMLEAALTKLAELKVQKEAVKQAEKARKQQAKDVAKQSVQQAVANVVQGLQNTSLGSGTAASAAQNPVPGPSSASSKLPHALLRTTSTSRIATPIVGNTTVPLPVAPAPTCTASGTASLHVPTPSAAAPLPPPAVSTTQPVQISTGATATATAAPSRPARSHLTQQIIRTMPNKGPINTRLPAQQPFPHDPRFGHGFPVDPNQLPDSNKLAPTKRHAMRTEFAHTAQQSNIYVNHFSIQLPQGTKLYEYIVDSTSPEWRDATRNKRKVFVRDLIDTCPELSNNINVIASDYRTKIIAGHDVLNGQNQISAQVLSYKRGTRDVPTQVPLTLTLNRTLDLDQLNNFVNGTNMNYEELGATEAMNIMISKAVADGAQDTFMAGNNRFYYRPGWHELGPTNQADRSGLIGIRGYYCSVRPGMGTVTLNVNTVTSAFHRPQTVQEYLASMGPFPDPAITQQDEIKKRENRLRDANGHLSGLRSYINFTRYQSGDADHSIDSDARRTKIINNIAERAKEVRFKRDPNDTHDISVWGHVAQKYPHVQKQPQDQLAVNVGSTPPNHKYYLAQNVDVLADQKYRFKLSSDLVASMIGIARRTPAENRSAILSEGLTSLRLHQHPPPPMLNVLGINIGHDMLTVPARRAQVPTVCYGTPQPPGPRQTQGPANPNVVAGNGSWSTNGRTFVDNRRKFNYQRNPRVHFLRVLDTSAPYIGWRNTFKTNFKNFHFKNGLQQLTEHPPRSWTSLNDHQSHWNVRHLQTVLTDLKDKQQIDLVVLMLPYKNALYAGRHALFKMVCDQLVGIKSAVFCEASMESSVRDRKYPNQAVDEIGNFKMGAYMGNYAMKLNLRLGNTNHVLRAQDLPVVIQAGQPLDCMILGADVTHPSGGSATGTPSIAAVVGSIDARFGMFPGAMRLQTERNEMIEDMQDMTVQCLERWAANNMIHNQRRLPQRILLYRDGVSESQYSAVREHEIRLIRAAYDIAWQHNFPAQQKSAGLPHITAVIVAKRHHTRFFPQDNRRTTHSGNCQTGTIVDSSITSPYYMDFFLMSHNIHNGTAKPAHYFVLENGMGFTAGQLQDLTNNLCYTYGKSTTAVSYAPPAYYADRLCERGRHYLKGLFDGNPDYRKMPPAQVRQTATQYWNRGPANDGNPWHPALNGTMFWM